MIGVTKKIHHLRRVQVQVLQQVQQKECAR